MSKEKIVLEILETNPKLDKEKVEKIVESLEKANPLENIKLETMFKQSLKAKLETIWWYEKKWTTSIFWKSFVFLLVPVFWILCFSIILSIFWENIFKNEGNIVITWTWNQNILSENVSNSWAIKTSTYSVKEEEKILEKNLNSENIEVSASAVRSSSEENSENISSNEKVLEKSISEEKTINMQKNFVENENLKLENPDEEVLKAVSLPENNFEDDEKIYIKSGTYSSNIPTNSDPFQLWVADDTEFNRNVLEKRWLENAPKTIEMRYMDENIYWEIRWSSSIKNSDVKVIKSDSSSNSDKNSIQWVSEFEITCKQNWYVFGKRYSRNFCQFNEKTCFEEDYYKWKCSFLK